LASVSSLLRNMAYSITFKSKKSLRSVRILKRRDFRMLMDGKAAQGPEILRHGHIWNRGSNWLSRTACQRQFNNSESAYTMQKIKIRRLSVYQISTSVSACTKEGQSSRRLGHTSSTSKFSVK
jgi:hypothetical protein